MLNIRKATARDAEGILEYCKIIGGETDNLTFGAEGIGLSAEKESQYLQSVFNSENDLYLIAEENDEILGVCNLTSFKRERLAHRAEISISVRKQMWGKHIGTELLRKTLEFAQNTNRIEIISLEVRTDNIAAISLYKKFGFEVIGTFKGFVKVDGEYFDCHIMGLLL